MLALASESRWWTLVLALLAFLLTGLMSLVLLLAVMGSMGDVRFGAVEFGVLVGMLLFYGVPAVLLFVSSQKLSTFVATGRTADLTSALSMQRTLWIVLGLMGTVWGALTTLRLVLTVMALLQGGAP